MATKTDEPVFYARTSLPLIEVGKGNHVQAGILKLPQPSRREAEPVVR
jgi:hypothetical protein